MDKNKQYIGHFDQLSVAEARELLGFIHQDGVVHFWLHVLAATLLCMLMWFKVEVPTLLTVIWYGAIVVLAIGCWITRSRFAKCHRMTHEQCTETVLRYRFMSLLLCTVWGISGIILFCDVPIGQAIHVCLLLVIAFSCWSMLLISRAEFYLQLALLLLPITLMLASQHDLKTNLLCIVILAFAGMTFLVTQMFSQLINHLFVTKQALTAQVHTDPVTQLINRSHFDQSFKTEWQRSAREGQALSLMLVEIDHFQEIELQEGSSISDQYLRVVTHCLKTVARRGSDTLARYGRSEFIALLPGTPLEEAVRVAESLRLGVEQVQLTNLPESVHGITVTIGVSACTPVIHPRYAEPGASAGNKVIYPAMLLSSADQALQRAKRNGSNRVEYQACGEDDRSITTVYPGQ